MPPDTVAGAVNGRHTHVYDPTNDHFTRSAASETMIFGGVGRTGANLPVQELQQGRRRRYRKVWKHGCQVDDDQQQGAAVLMPDHPADNKSKAASKMHFFYSEPAATAAHRPVITTVNGTSIPGETYKPTTKPTPRYQQQEQESHDQVAIDMPSDADSAVDEAMPPMHVASHSSSPSPVPVFTPYYNPYMPTLPPHPAQMHHPHHVVQPHHHHHHHQQQQQHSYQPSQEYGYMDPAATAAVPMHNPYAYPDAYHAPVGYYYIPSHAGYPHTHMMDGMTTVPPGQHGHPSPLPPQQQQQQQHYIPAANADHAHMYHPTPQYNPYLHAPPPASPVLVPQQQPAPHHMPQFRPPPPAASPRTLNHAAPPFTPQQKRSKVIPSVPVAIPQTASALFAQAQALPQSTQPAAAATKTKPTFASALSNAQTASKPTSTSAPADAEPPSPQTTAVAPTVVSRASSLPTSPTVPETPAVEAKSTPTLPADETTAAPAAADPPVLPSPKQLPQAAAPAKLSTWAERASRTAAASGKPAPATAPPPSLVVEPPTAQPQPQEPQLPPKLKASKASTVPQPETAIPAAKVEPSEAKEPVQPTSEPAVAAEPAAAAEGTQSDAISSLASVDPNAAVPPTMLLPLNTMTSLPTFLTSFRYSFHTKLIRPRGLINNGNMCFMNVILQPLVHCAPFYNLVSAIAKQVIHSFNSKTPLVDSLVLFLKEYESKVSADTSVQLEPVLPEYVYDALRTQTRFESLKGRQEDAEEVLGYLLDGLHTEFVKVLQSVESSTVTPQTNGTPAESADSTSDDWLVVGTKHKPVTTRSVDVAQSPISKIFGGKMRSMLRVPGKKESMIVEPFQSLKLDIEPDNIATLQDALTHLTKLEVIEDFHKGSGGGAATAHATNQSLIDTLPPVVVMHLKRFQFDARIGDTVKITKHVQFDTVIHFRPELFVHGNRPAKAVEYRLFAVINHHGGLAAGGHYTCDVLRADNTWLRIDDTQLSPVEASDVIAKQADREPYLLFYESINYLSRDNPGLAIDRTPVWQEVGRTQPAAQGDPKKAASLAAATAAPSSRIPPPSTSAQQQQQQQQGRTSRSSSRGSQPAGPPQQQQQRTPLATTSKRSAQR
ncbi:hypothetical protein RI367_006415 [Sorochytrium milnesiophthora]